MFGGGRWEQKLCKTWPIPVPESPLDLTGGGALFSPGWNLGIVTECQQLKLISYWDVRIPAYKRLEYTGSPFCFFQKFDLPPSFVTSNRSRGGAISQAISGGMHPLSPHLEAIPADRNYLGCEHILPSKRIWKISKRKPCWYIKVSILSKDCLRILA